MALTDTAIRSAKYIDKQFKLSDEKGMYILVKQAGKYFRMDYRFAGKRKTLAIGVYPEVTLKEAREKRDEARKLLANGIDPAQARKIHKQGIYEDAENSFFNVATEWFLKNKSKWSEDYAQKKWHAIEKDIFPHIGSRPIKDIAASELLIALNKIQDRGAVETGHRVKCTCGEIFRYGIVTGRCDRDPSQDLKGALVPNIVKNYSAFTELSDIKGLLKAVDSYKGEFTTKCALKIAPYLFVRPGELRQAEWSEIDFENRLWKIPAEKMKMKRPHLVPLSEQALSIFKKVYPLTGRWKYVFPSVRSKDRPMSNNTINAALRRMGFTVEEMTGHGFRTIASTLLHDNDFETAHIEMQLAHVETNKTKGAYNRAKYLPQRIKMMQWWADYLDKLKND